MMFDLWRLQLATARMMAEAQTVIGMRLLGMAGVLPAADNETVRMVTEKQAAFADAGVAAVGTLMRGGTPIRAMEAALQPIGRTTRANSRRLTRPRRR